VLERALILSKGGPVTFGPFLGPRSEESAAAPDETDSPLPLEEAISRHIQRVLRQTGGKVHGAGGAAELLGINPSTLRSKMRKLDIVAQRAKKIK